MVFVCLVAFFAVVAGVNAIMIRAAVTTFGGVETENAYKAGLAYARDIHAAQLQDGRQWQVKAQLSPDTDGGTWVEVLVRDAVDQPVSGLAAEVRLAHPTDRRFDQIVVMHEDSAGRFRGITRLAAGQRDLVIELARGGERMFRSKSRVVVR